jgi:hypothetical protein
LKEHKGVVYVVRFDARGDYCLSGG